ncbi:DUF1579 family protein [Frigoriglobus tundricola]|uniref:DUF1579 domain-containing protein n=1 Tax=Frigoriglobus tundricola TaxID=2774151 RepID=A0A6M5YK87_9BACT|nr:DUF1579 family protein [Frigoriglobus tundricola]QJW94479.1 hypothetical protein FTUN_2000 [Frigoriglobus tundricola]
MFRCALLTLSVALAGVTAAAQQPGKSDDKKDPQAKFEPRSKPGAGQKFLEQFVGDWDVTKTFHPRTGEPTKTKGECRQKMIHDGRFLQSEFTFAGDNGTTTGTGQIGFEPETGKFTSVWTDSRQTRMSFRQSDEKFDGQKIVLIGKELGGGAKDGRRSQTTTTFDADRKTIVHRQHAIDADGKERLVMELVLTRKVPPAPAK